MLAKRVTSYELVTSKHVSWIRDLFLVLLGSFLIGLCALISVKLPWTPVPLALASHVCIALGAILGSRRGALAVLAHLAQGALGLPVFALGTSGLLKLLGPSGGYLIGYVLAAYLTGYLIEKMRERTLFRVFLALAAGTIIVLFFGVFHLSFFVGPQLAIQLGVFPFLLGDTVKLFAAYGVINLMGCRLFHQK